MHIRKSKPILHILLAMLVLASYAVGSVTTETVNNHYQETLYNPPLVTESDIWRNVTFENETTVSINVPLTEVVEREHTTYTFYDTWELPGTFIDDKLMLYFSFYIEVENYQRLYLGDVDCTAWFNGYIFNETLTHAEPYTSPHAVFNTENAVKYGALTRTPASHPTHPCCYVYNGTLRNFFGISTPFAIYKITATKLVLTGNLIESSDMAVALEWHKTYINQTVKKSTVGFYFGSAYYKTYVPPDTEDLWINISYPYINEINFGDIFTPYSFISSYPKKEGPWPDKRINTFCIGQGYQFGEHINISLHYNDSWRGAPEPGWYYFGIATNYIKYNYTGNSTWIINLDTEIAFTIKADLVCGQDTHSLSDLSTVIDYIDYQGAEMNFRNTTYEKNITETKQTYTLWDNETYYLYYYNNSAGSDNISYNGANYINGTWTPERPQEPIDQSLLESNPTNPNGADPGAWCLRYDNGTIYRRTVVKLTENITTNSRTYQNIYTPEINFTLAIGYPPDLIDKIKTYELQLYIDKNSFLEDRNVFTNSSEVLKAHNFNIETHAFPPEYYTAFNSTYIKNTWAAQLVQPIIKGRYTWVTQKGTIGAVRHYEVMPPWDKYITYTVQIQKAGLDVKIRNAETGSGIVDAQNFQTYDYDLSFAAEIEKINVSTQFVLIVNIIPSSGTPITDTLTLPEVCREYVVYRPDKLENFKVLLKHDIDPKKNLWPSEKLFIETNISTTPGGLTAEYYKGADFADEALVKKQVENTTELYWGPGETPFGPLSSWAISSGMLTVYRPYSIRLEGMIDLSSIQPDQRIYFYGYTFWGDRFNVYIDNKIVLSSELQTSSSPPPVSLSSLGMQQYDFQFGIWYDVTDQGKHYFKIEYTKLRHTDIFGNTIIGGGFALQWALYNSNYNTTTLNFNLLGFDINVTACDQECISPRGPINSSFLHYSMHIYNEVGAYSYPQPMPGYPYIGYIYNALFLEKKTWEYSPTQFEFYYFYNGSINATSNVTLNSEYYAGYWAPALPEELESALRNQSLENIEGYSYTINSNNTKGENPNEWFIMLGKAPVANKTYEFNPFSLSFGFYSLIAMNVFYPYPIYEFHLTPTDLAQYKIKEEWIKFDVEGAGKTEVYWPTEKLRNPNPKYIGIFKQIFHNYPYSINYTDILNPEVTLIGLTNTWTPSTAFVNLTDNDTWNTDEVLAHRGSAQMLVVNPMNTSIEISFDQPSYKEGDKVVVTIQLKCGNTGTASYNGQYAGAYKKLEVTYPVSQQVGNTASGEGWVFKEYKTENLTTDSEGKIVIDNDNVRAQWGYYPVKVVFDYDGIELRSAYSELAPAVTPGWLSIILVVIGAFIFGIAIIEGIKYFGRYTGGYKL